MSSRICIAYAASRIRGKEVQSANASVSHSARQTQLDSISNQGRLFPCWRFDVGFGLGELGCGCRSEEVAGFTYGR